MLLYEGALPPHVKVFNWEVGGGIFWPIKKCFLKEPLRLIIKKELSGNNGYSERPYKSWAVRGRGFGFYILKYMKENIK